MEPGRRAHHPVGVVELDAVVGQGLEVRHLPGHEEQSAAAQAQAPLAHPGRRRLEVAGPGQFVGVRRGSGRGRSIRRVRPTERRTGHAWTDAGRHGRPPGRARVPVDAHGRYWRSRSLAMWVTWISSVPA